VQLVLQADRQASAWSLGLASSSRRHRSATSGESERKGKSLAELQRAPLTRWTDRLLAPAVNPGSRQAKPKKATRYFIILSSIIGSLTRKISFTYSYMSLWPNYREDRFPKKAKTKNEVSRACLQPFPCVRIPFPPTAAFALRRGSDWLFASATSRDMFPHLSRVSPRVDYTLRLGEYDNVIRSSTV
jgi:hypothetical protein